MKRELKLDAKQCAPMDELMKLVGLHAVKEEALEVYCKVHADSNLPPAARVPKRLNFAFMGNPGTGKVRGVCSN